MLESNKIQHISSEASRISLRAEAEAWGDPGEEGAGRGPPGRAGRAGQPRHLCSQQQRTGSRAFPEFVGEMGESTQNLEA